MKLPIKLVSVLLVSSVMLIAADYSSMSTQDMMKMRGNVPMEDREAFRTEMQKRVPMMSPEERREFNANPGQGKCGGNKRGNMGNGQNRQKCGNSRN